ncbi:MAG: hypothetical protein B7Y31_09090, partial [Novosphingobium sp. 16-62-11]
MGFARIAQMPGSAGKCRAGDGAAFLRHIDLPLHFIGSQPTGQSQGERDPFAHVAHWLRDADVRVANLESVVATTGTPEPG